MDLVTAEQARACVLAARIPVFAPAGTGFHFDCDVEEFRGFAFLGEPGEGDTGAPVLALGEPAARPALTT